jgi:hypothetical protein
MDYVTKALRKPMNEVNGGRLGSTQKIPDVLFVTHTTPEHIYATEAASQLVSMVAALDISARRVGVEVIPTAWQKTRWTFYAVGIIFMFLVGGFLIGVVLDDVNPKAVVEAHGVSAPIYDMKECYDRIKGIACKVQ